MNIGVKKAKYGQTGSNGILTTDLNSRWMIKEYFVD
jgi:hypothetical protein